MATKLRDVIELPSMSDIKLVAGATGIDRVLYCSHVVDIPEVSNWVQGGELLFITGIGIQAHLEELSNIVRECFKKNVAGLVINVGPYIPKTPEEVIVLADGLGFPVFELPWQSKVGEITRMIYNFIVAKDIGERSERDILETILYGTIDKNDTLSIRAAACNCDLTQAHQIMVIKFEQLTAYLRDAREFSEQQALIVKLQMENTVQRVFERNNKKVLILFRLDTLIIFLPTPRDNNKRCGAKEIAAELLQKFKIEFAELKLNIGWGNSYTDIRDARKSLTQAEQSLRVAKSLSGTNNFMDFNDLGFYKVLFNVKEREELENFRNEVLQNLLEHDKKHGSALVNTLSVYLEENENCSRVSERLYIHKNTLQYRLQKIAEISGRNLSNPKDRSLLNLATIVNNFLFFSYD
ncbi:MAG: PucR family transcriptional regulator [Negativicutes bacterium]